MEDTKQTTPKQEGKPKTWRRVMRIILNVIMYAFLALCVFTLIFSIVSKKDSDGAVNIFGYQTRIVISQSMEESEYTDVSKYEIKSIPLRSMVFIQLVPEDEAEANEWYSELKVGDVLTFRYIYTTQETITHRIVDIQEKSTGGYIVKLEGDNKLSEDGILQQTIDTSLGQDSTNYIIGKVVGQSIVLGNVIWALKQPLGLALIIILPCFVIVVCEVLRIISVCSADKKKKVETQARQQMSEIEALKRQLELMQQSLNQQQDSNQQQDPNQQQDSNKQQDLNQQDVSQQNLVEQQNSKEQEE